HHHAGVHDRGRRDAARAYDGAHLIDHDRYAGEVTGLELIVKPDDGGDRPREWVVVSPRHLDGALGPGCRLRMVRTTHRDRGEHRCRDTSLDPCRWKRESIPDHVVEEGDPALQADQDAFAQEAEYHAGPGDQRPDRITLTAEGDERLLEAALAVGVPFRDPP